MRKKSRTLLGTVRENLQADKERTEKLLARIVSRIYNADRLSVASLRDADTFRQSVERVYEAVFEENTPLEQLAGSISTGEIPEKQPSNAEKAQTRTRASRYLSKSEAIDYCQLLDAKRRREPITKSGYRQRINYGINEGKIEERADGFVRSKDVRVWNNRQY